MNSRLSTDELFHFTRFEKLISIIKEGFYPRYNLEHTFLSDLFERPSAVETIPMVCFCDIPLNLVHEHSSKYGRCAIGLDKKWGEKYGVNPVIYVHKNSQIGDAISALGNSFSGYNSSMILKGSDMKIFSMISTFAKGLQYLSYFVKQYERLKDEEYIYNNMRYKFTKGRFYDEREWRFVPSNEGENFWLVDASIIHDEARLSEANEKLIKHALKFNIEDIKYLVCETEDEKLQLIDTLSERYQLQKEEILNNINIILLENI